MGIPKQYFKPAPVKPEPMFGIDVSHHNGNINWPLVAANSPKVDFVFIKATEGQTGKDNKAKINAEGAKAAGIRIGYYHYATLNQEDEMTDARKEAAWFMFNIKFLPTPDLPLILDLEDPNPKIGLDQREVLTWVLTFFETLNAAGYTSYALYSYTPFLTTRLPANHGLGNIHLWLAQYNNKPAPVMPKGWDKYWIWQYSATGKIAGIKGPVDLNRSIDAV